VDKYSKKPPVIAVWILKRILPAYDSEYLLNDYEYLYRSLLREKGKYFAWFWYWRQILISFFPFLKHSLYWGTVMFKSYFKTALRNIKRQKSYSLINILGLAIGMTCCILMLMWVLDELSYEKFHENADNLYRVRIEQHTGDQIYHHTDSPYPLGSILKEEYPEIINFTKYIGGYRGWNLRYGEKSFSGEILAFADPSFFEMFSFPFIKGEGKGALEERYSVILTEELAHKCFGDEDPIGKVMQMTGTDLKVTGVIKNIPHNSHIQFDYIVPIINQTDWRKQDFKSWERGCTLYIQLIKNSPGKNVSQQISGVVKEHHPESGSIVSLQPLKKVRLYSHFIRDNLNVGKGNINYVYIFALTALCILLIACINFMNLSTARSGNRAKEVGMRKVAGAQRKDIIKQFFGESVLLSLIALLFALLFTYLVLPVFNNLSGKQLSLNVSGNILFIFSLIIISILTGIVSGSYPALFLSSFQPVRVLKGIVSIRTRSRSPLRKILVVAQFAFTIILLIGTTAIYNQLSFMENKDLGFDKENIITFSTSGKYRDNYESARVELLQNPNILNVTKAFPPGAGRRIAAFNWEGKDPSEEIALCPVPASFDFIETYNMEMVEGRSFSREFLTDSLNCIINETAARVMGLESPVGTRISFTGNRAVDYWFNTREGIIIGVVKDYHNGSLHNEIPPLVIKFSPRAFVINVKINSENIAGTVSFLEKKWKEFVPGRPFTYNFFSDSIEGNYRSEERIGTIFRYFTFLAIFIACLGLFGLASFMAEQKTKEIGIRKVLGSSVSGIMLILSNEFTKWVLIANVIAWPAGYFVMNRWLQNFAYRIDLGIGIFLFSAVLALIIALLTTGYQTIKAASANPIDSLRYE